MRGHVALSLALVTIAACSFAYSGGVSLTPSVRMDRWDVQSIAIGLRTTKSGICPRETVQLAVFAEADHRKRDKHKRLETWVGQRGSLGRMGFEEFSYTLSGGQLDPRTGWFTPNPDMLATAVHGFGFEVRYKREPEVAPVSMRVAPVYDCVSWMGGSGPTGGGGAFGIAGDAGGDGEGGSDTSSGGAGGMGGAGGSGTPGGDGGPGPNLRAYATLVRTPFHRHLVLVALDGDARDVILFDPARTLEIAAQGGAGGMGGPGGPGGAGGAGGSGNPGGAGGNGNNGGNGSNGGNGGPGGSVVLVLDAAQPELERAFVLTAYGGAGGSGGFGGAAGDGGAGGSALGENASAGAAGAAGAAGSGGYDGQPGPPGTVAIELGDVTSVFGTLPGGVEKI